MYQLEYGDQLISLELPSHWRLLSEIKLTPYNPGKTQEEIVQEALAHPVGTNQRLREIVAGASSVAVTISDQTRTTGSAVFLPYLLKEIQAGGIEEAQISLFFTNGTHRPPRPEEQRTLLSPPIYEAFSRRGKIFVHDPGDETNLTFLGVTSRGTRVRINKRFLDHDVKILTGAIVFHYFAGFGGGRKSILPGLSSHETIRRNHSLNLHPTEDKMDPDVRIGDLHKNPVALDMLEAARLARPDYIFNTVVNEKKEIIFAVAGELQTAHEKGCQFAAKIFGQTIEQKADIVIATTQTAKNWIQSHKSLYNASCAVKENGIIILLAACPEGIGEPEFMEWARLGIKGIFQRLRKAPALSGQTAYSSLTRGRKTIIVTGLARSECEIMNMRKVESLQEAMELADTRTKARGITGPTVYLMPYAGYTVPFFRE